MKTYTQWLNEAAGSSSLACDIYCKRDNGYSNSKLNQIIEKILKSKKINIKGVKFEGVNRSNTFFEYTILLDTNATSNTMIKSTLEEDIKKLTDVVSVEVYEI